MIYTPLAPTLIPDHASPSARACVIIPARNEEKMLPRTLDALRLQHDLKDCPVPPDHYEVILLLNNCTDASQTVAELYQKAHPTFALHIASRTISPEQAHVGTARRLLMDTAYHRLQRAEHPRPVILSTDADTVVAPDWIARNLAAIDAGAEAVGGVINLFPEDLEALQKEDRGTYSAYESDRQLQSLVAQLESLLDPDPADPWPRHLAHFGASLACTTAIYAEAGGLPPIKPLEDVAFIDALRKAGARIRHCPQTRIYTSARLDGRVQIGLSGQLKVWKNQFQNEEPHLVDSAHWIGHRFRSLAALRRIAESPTLPSLSQYPDHWRTQIANLHADRLPTPRFLELLDCNRLIEELFIKTGYPRHTEISETIATLTTTLSLLHLSS